MSRNARGVLFAIVAVAVSLSVSFAQPPMGPHPIDTPAKPVRPMPRPHPLLVPTPSPSASPSATPAPALKLPITRRPMPSASPSAKSRAGNSREDDILGARMRLNGPPLPKMTTANTVYLNPGQSFDTRRGRGGRLRTMSVSGSITVTPSASGSCTGTVGTIYNLNCQVSWQVINIDTNHAGELHQDYFIDASGTNVDTQQTVGSSYDPLACSGTISATGYCGNSHTQTLSDAGVYVLASAVCTNWSSGAGSTCSGVWYWETVEYIVVTTSSTSLATYEDAGNTIESTNFYIPTSGTSTIYLLLNGLTVNDAYVVYMEFTSYMGGQNPCAYMIYNQGSGAPTGTQEQNGFCDPNTVAGFQANQLTSSLTWSIDNTYSPGTYSIVVYDKSAQKRVLQRQVSLDPLAGSGSGQISITPVGGSVSSPTPAPQTTSSPLVSPAPPMQRFAYDGPTESSDSGFQLSVSGLSGNRSFFLNIADPNGYTAPGNEIAFTSSSGGFSGTIAEGFDTTTEPENYGPNTYTVSVIQQGTTNTVAATGFQIVGYNALTQFTNSSGTVSGTALTIAKNSTAPGGLQFLNDGDSVYGTSNGDALRGIFFTTNKSGISIILPCTPCTSEVVTDSAGNSWNVDLTTSNGNGSNANSNLLITPVSSSTTLANGAYIDLKNLTFQNTAGNSGCASGCEGYTQILPVDGKDWSGFNSNPASNPVYFTNSAGNTWAATSYITHLGTTPTGSAYAATATTCASTAGAGCEVHGYEPSIVQDQTVSGIDFPTQGIYALNEPYASSTGTSDVFAVTVTNNSSQGGGGSSVTFTGIEVAFPTDYFQSGASITLSLDNNSPSKWVKVTSGAGVPPNCSQTNVICMKNNTAVNSGIPGGGQSQTIWIDAAGLPKSSFSYEEFTVQSFAPATVNASAQLTGLSVPVGATNPYTVDSLAFGAYSLDESLMSAYTSPSAVGTSTNYPVTFVIKNTSTAQDANPDYVDAIVIDDPSNYLSGGSLTTPVPSPAASPSGWSLLASKSDGSGGTLYWFGACPGNYNWSDGPPTSGQPPVNPSLAKCSTASDEYNAVAPGGQFNFQANVAAPSTSGTLTFKMWAHGANGNGWSSEKDIPVSVTPISAVSGFTNAGGYPTGNSWTDPNQPYLSGDSSTTYGNAFVYTITNKSATGASNNITQATINIPYKTYTGGTGTDGTYYWTLEPAAPSITVNLIDGTGKSSASGCTVASQSPNSAGNGYIKISGCTLPPGDTWQVSFYMKMPYLPNSEFEFQTTVNNGAITASENYQGDTYIKIYLGASLVVEVNPSPDPAPAGGGGNPSPFCSLCTFTTTTTPEQVNFGSVSPGGFSKGTDVVMVQVYTDAANPYGGWNLYESIDNNPAQTGSPTNEFIGEVDSAASTTGAGLTYSNTSAFGVLPSPAGATTFLMASAPSTNSARRTPYDIVGSYEVVINSGGGGSTSPETHTVTFTFVPQ